MLCHDYCYTVVLFIICITRSSAEQERDVSVKHKGSVLCNKHSILLQWYSQQGWVRLINQCHRSIDASENCKNSLKTLVKNSWILDQTDSSVTLHLHFHKLPIKMLSKKKKIPFVEGVKIKLVYDFGCSSSFTSDYSQKCNVQESLLSENKYKEEAAIKTQYSEFQKSHAINIMLYSLAPSIFICSYKVRLLFFFLNAYLTTFQIFPSVTK